MSKLVTLGEVLVEVMAEDIGRGFRSPLRLLGPYPAGRPPSSSTKSPSLANRAASSAVSVMTTSAG